ncbi:hypothetical protein ACFQ88_02930 [Paenibacillus sp. NPDC056579]|uniref:hypothetical protein n=1 Tax=Paenibacillus sp. NPDC056579 TaxID=3345871 RepID=UPI003697DDD5
MENKDDQSAVVALNYHSPDRMVQGQYVAHVRISHTVVLTGGCGHGPGEAKQYELVSWDKSGGL